MSSFTRTRLHALIIAKEVLEKGRWLDRLILPFLISYRDKRDKKFLTKLTYGTVRMKLFLDWVIEKYLKGYKLSELTPWIRNILRISLYQIFFMERVPDYAAVSEGVSLAERFGHKGVKKLVNAILRRASEEKPKPSELWILHSHPRWLYERWRKRFGEERTIELMKFNNTDAPIYIRINLLKTGRDDFISLLKEKNVDFEEVDFPKETLRIKTPPQDVPIPTELYYAQDFSSQIIPYLLSPKRGSFIIDWNSAPGGKATHIAQLIGNEGHILGIDLYLSRLKLEKETIERIGAKCVSLIAADSRSFSPLRKPKFALCDVPCSGLGTLRRRPELKWRMREERIAELKELEFKLLTNAARNLEKGGALVYSTCTIEREENEEVVDRFLKENKDFELQDARYFVPSHFVKNGYVFVDGVRFDSDFAFAARFEKKMN